ncbi:unnamed protein product [Acanthoscelides obtectus]|uniref:HAT C-terminal dimerisation domain-containing protein n=1 Tax=Acanthoscelides obtectus TaxID=200917 RepID=A0A9P0LVC1_ACAOB|nr:unnamed protein product [Acanthoscelides obtectus]CAK1626600.1 hypothetical protein AOBTE_LOCUS3969 [Acanthoscelides obtectus]
MPIASRILNGPPSSASSERNWSLHGLIHTSKRNRLSQDKIQKLVAIHSNLVINEKQTFIYDARPVPLLASVCKDYAVLSVHEDEAKIESESDAWSEDSNSDSDENIPLSALVK